MMRPRLASRFKNDLLKFEKSALKDLDALVLFARVVEAGSFSEAARRMRSPVSTVSRKIADLEQRLGVRLLERTTRSLRVTSVGAEIFQQARRGCEIGEAVAAIVDNARTGTTEILRVSTPPSISETLVSPLVSAFQARHPGRDVRCSRHGASRRPQGRRHRSHFHRRNVARHDAGRL